MWSGLRCSKVVRARQHGRFARVDDAVLLARCARHFVRNAISATLCALVTAGAAHASHEPDEERLRRNAKRLSAERKFSADVKIEGHGPTEPTTEIAASRHG